MKQGHARQYQDHSAVAGPKCTCGETLHLHAIDSQRRWTWEFKWACVMCWKDIGHNAFSRAWSENRSKGIFPWKPEGLDPAAPIDEPELSGQMR
jgi:hypothetical protein